MTDEARLKALARLLSPAQKNIILGIPPSGRSEAGGQTASLRVLVRRELMTIHGKRTDLGEDLKRYLQEKKAAKP